MRRIINFVLLTITLCIGSSAFAGSVNRALFTIGIDNREPVIMVDSISSDSYSSISFFTELSSENASVRSGLNRALNIEIALLRLLLI